MTATFRSRFSFISGTGLVSQRRSQSARKRFMSRIATGWSSSFLRHAASQGWVQILPQIAGRTLSLRMSSSASRISRPAQGPCTPERLPPGGNWPGKEGFCAYRLSERPGSACLPP